MKVIVKRLIREEKGAALVLTLVLLLIGGLIMAPLLAHMGTGQIAGQVHEKRMDEVYAADAGVEEALWWIVSGLAPPNEGISLLVNEKPVVANVTETDRGYRIVSTAQTPDVSTTEITADYWRFCFADNAITSRGDVDLGNNTIIDGTIQYGHDFTYKPNAQYGETIHEVYQAWPPSHELYDYYYKKYVEDETNFEYRSGDDTVKAKDYSGIHPTHPGGPLHWTGNLILSNSPPDSVPELKLNGTLYVDGHLDFPQPGSGAYTIDLNGQTILVEGNIDMPSNAITIKGSGNIIAVGDIWFQPGIASSDDSVLLLSLTGDIHFQPNGEFTGFIMSVEQTVTFKPNGDFKGSVAGDVKVELESNVLLAWRSITDSDIDFPFHDYSVWRIQSWNISLLTETG